MGFVVARGKVKSMYLPVTPSTALTRRNLVTFSSGKIVAATSGTTAVNIFGILDDATITSSDDDYATDRLVKIEVPVERHVEYEFDVTSGLVAADVGLEVDLTDAGTVNRAASAIDAVKVTKVISTTKGQGFVKFNGAY